MPDILRAAMALCTVLALLAAAAVALRRFAPSAAVGRPGTPGLSVVGRRPLDARRTLVWIRWQDRDYLLCLGPAGDTLVGCRDAGDIPPPPTQPTPAPEIEP